MSRKSKKREDNPQYWQSEAVNERTYLMYRQQIIQLALSRFKWIGLPPTCDSRFIEWCLLFTGSCTIAHPKKQPGIFYSTKCVQDGPINVYDNPVRWRSTGNNGWNFKCDARNGVWVWDNKQRVPILDWVELYSRRLAAFDRVLDVNLWQQHKPAVLTAPQTKVADLANVMKQVAGYEPAIAGYDGLMGDEGVKYSVLDLKVDYIADKLQTAQTNMWNRVYWMLGIETMSEKNDRLVTDEVSVLSAPSQAMRLDPLNERQKACAKFNERFGLEYGIELACVWNEDLFSENYNYMGSAPAQEENGGDGDAA